MSTTNASRPKRSVRQREGELLAHSSTPKSRSGRIHHQRLIRLGSCNSPGWTWASFYTARRRNEREVDEGILEGPSRTCRVDVLDHLPQRHRSTGAVAGDPESHLPAVGRRLAGSVAVGF